MAKKKAVPVKKAAAKKTSVKTKPARPVGRKIAPPKATVKKVVKPARLPAGKAGSTGGKVASKPATKIAKSKSKAAPIKVIAKTIAKVIAKKVVAKKVVTKKIATQKVLAKKATTAKVVTKSTKTVVKPIAKTVSKTEPKKIKGPTELLADAIVEGILEVKGRNISVLNLQGIHNRVCDYFIICQADSNTQVNAIAGSVEVMVKKITGERPYRKEGFENSEWILVDYVTVVVHVFQTEVRNFYNLESLWADAEVTQIAFDK